ncbi:MAG: hypothetical protein H0U53_04675, partial [Actinobacteria bacterium]|nr:hypothetical protein [Actinomycetota bacterium]
LQMLGGVLDAKLCLGDIPQLPGAADLCAAGVWPGGSARNREAASRFVSSDDADSDDARYPLLFDAQTSGGLLIAVAAEKVGRLVEELRAAGDSEAAQIGELNEGTGMIEVAA